MKIKDDTKERIVLIVTGLILGFILGLVVNFLWYIFLALIVGWGDSGPDWYIRIQDNLQKIIVIASMIGVLVWLHLWYQKGKPESGAQQQNRGDGE